MEEQNRMLSAMMGRQGQEALQMMERMERLKKLMGNSLPQQKMIAVQEETELFARSRSENMITAALPFLDRGCQREMYVLVRLMEMRRVLQSGFLETREKQEEGAAVRRQKLLQAVGAYLPAEEQKQLEMLAKTMLMKEWMGGEQNGSMG